MSTQTLARIISAPGNQIKQELNKNHLRIYGHTLCPFVARSRYALALKKIPFQDVQMDLTTKA
jgi:glutathione S-transferase